MQQVQGQLQASWPQLQPLMDMPGAIEMRAELLANLSRRFFARTIKMIFGPQVRLPWHDSKCVRCCLVPFVPAPRKLQERHMRAQHALFSYWHNCYL